MKQKVIIEKTEKITEAQINVKTRSIDRSYLPSNVVAAAVW